MLVATTSSLAAVVGVAAGVSACTASNSSSGQSADAASNDGSSVAACLAPISGASCATDEMPCQPAEPCCVGYRWGCNSVSHTWQRDFLGCPPPPSCMDASGE